MTLQNTKSETLNTETREERSPHMNATTTKQAELIKRMNEREQQYPASVRRVWADNGKESGEQTPVKQVTTQHNELLTALKELTNKVYSSGAGKTGPEVRWTEYDNALSVIAKTEQH